MMRHLFIAILAAGLSMAPTRASASGSDIQLWPTVTLNHGFGEHWGGHLMSRVRFDQNVSRTKDILLRPWVSWEPLEGLAFDLGYDYNHSFHSNDEHRIWQAAEYRFTWRRLTVNNRLRLDQRFVENVDGVVARLRYRLRGTHPVGSSDWYGTLSNETFANVNDRGTGPVHGFEQNRVRLAAGVHFLKRLQAESGYEWQYVERRGDSSEHRHVFFIAFTIDTGDGRLWSPR
jgi:hypothetical protein